MAGFHISDTMVILLLSSAATMFIPSSSAAAGEEFTVPPAVLAKLASELPREPAAGYYEYLDQCSKKLTMCVQKRSTPMSLRMKPISLECCHHLVDMGQACHNGLVKTYLRWPDLKPSASIVLPKSDNAGKRCVAVVTASPSPSN